jgi:hypothetical protein
MAASNQTARSYFTNKINMELFRVNHQPRNPYKFSRQWHEVDLPWRSDEQLAWCAEQFGPHPRQADAWCRWCVDAFTVKFRDLRDYNWYMLRWGSE